MSGEDEREYRLARRALLDVSSALKEHLRAIILVGAQAVYVNIEAAQNRPNAVPVIKLNTRPSTTDADLALDPAILDTTPAIEAVMRSAHFTQGNQPGMWVIRLEEVEVAVDLMVPAATIEGGTKHRGARLPGRSNIAARTAKGLEAALVDNSRKVVTALEPTDTRSVELNVAGPAALLVAKLHKIAERAAKPRRQEAKDALDIYRLLVAFEAKPLGATFAVLCQDPRSREVTKEAIGHLGSLFDSDGALGPRLAAQEVEFRDDPDVIAQSLTALANDLFSEVEHLRGA